MKLEGMGNNVTQTTSTSQALHRSWRKLLQRRFPTAEKVRGVALVERFHEVGSGLVLTKMLHFQYQLV